nr:unnamed protein product [Meloidogyne enterolobii]
MKFYYEYTDQNVLEIKGKDFKNFEKESILLKENIGKENFNESEDLIAYSDFEFIKILKFSKLRKSFRVKAKKNWKKTTKSENFKRIFKLNVRKQFKEYSFSKKYPILKRINTKMKLLKNSVLYKINAKMKRTGKRQEKFGWRKRKIKGRFFHGVRRRLSLKDMITLIRASNHFPNFQKEKRRFMEDLKPKEDLHSVSETNQVFQTSQFAMISIEKTRVPIKIRKFRPVSATGVFERISKEISEMFQLRRLPLDYTRHPKPFESALRSRILTKHDVEDAVI